MFRFTLFSAAIILVLLAGLSLAGIPKLINYQGMLTDNSGTPLNGTYDITFKIYNASSGGDKRWEETQSSVSVSNGLFNVILGGMTPISLDFSEDYWLDITVGTEQMPERLKFTSVGYAYRAEKADTAGYALSSPSGPGDYTWTFRLTDTADTTITTGGGWGVARCGNTLYGNADSTHVNLGVASTTGESGQDYKYCTVGGGYSNAASGGWATVAGGSGNTASGYWATVEGGVGNTASGGCATVGGGWLNTADTSYATVGGGWMNIASGYSASVGGGRDNAADSGYATVAGGYGNTGSGGYATVGGGYSNTASGGWATVGGGDSSTASGDYATVGGGRNNAADISYATVGGGKMNTASGQAATVGGGYSNTASEQYATVGGGYYNTASGQFATVGGGYENNANADYATVGGGEIDTASGRWAFVAGGYKNTASGQFAIVPGGVGNTAGGNYSFAAGRMAQANHLGTFVWADSSVNASFNSTGDNQFLIRAAGGVGIGTNSPEEMLHVQNATEGVIKVGTPTANGKATVIFEEGNDDAMALRYNGSANELRIDDETQDTARMVIERSGNVGIGTTNPTFKLHVVGDIYCTGKLTSVGGNDPPYVLYNPETRESIEERVAREVSADKLDGAVLFWNGEDLRFEVYLPLPGEFRDLNGNLLATRRGSAE